MDKLVAIRIKNNDGTYSNDIPLSVLAVNIDWDGTHTLSDVLGNVDLDKGDLQTQINSISDDEIQVDSTLTATGMAADAKVVGDAIHNLQGLVGTPLVATTAASMTNIDKIYVYTGLETGYTNGNWYYYDGTAWVSGGVYNSIAMNMDTAPTSGSSNVVTSAGIKAALDSVDSEIGELKENISKIEPGLSDDAKTALLNCFQHVAWIDEHGREYYDDLYSALYVGRKLISISADFDAGQAVIYADDSLDSLKQYLTVTAHYNDSTSEIVDGYALSGTLSVGTNTITVTYDTESTTVTVNDVVDFYNRHRVSYPDDADLLFLKDRQGEPATIDSVTQFVLAIMGDDRSAFLTNHGKNNASVRLDDGSYINNYFIPVPSGATGFTITWNASKTIRVYASCINLYQDTGGGHHFYRWQDSGGWITSSGNSLTFSRTINYICLNVDNPQQGTINAFAVEFNFS